MESQNVLIHICKRQQLIEFAKQCIDVTLLSVNRALLSMEAGPEPFDTEQMSGYQELMSVRQALLTFGYELMSVVPTQKAIHDIHETFNPDQLSVVKALKSITETLKPIVDALKPSAQLFQNPMHIYRPYPLYNCSCFSDQKTKTIPPWT